MELNKKILTAVLSQIRAHEDVIVFQDSPVDGCLDILYAPKYPVTPRAVHRMTVRVGARTGLFDDAPVEKLKRPIPVYLARIRAILKNDSGCVFENGCLNGVCVEIDKIDSINYGVFETIMKQYWEFSDKIAETLDFAIVSMGRSDWAHLVSECVKFVANDPVRIFLNGICFDFFNGGEDCVHIAATNGQKLILLKQTASHKNFVSEKDRFIVFPAYLFVPKSEYNMIRLRLSGSFGQLLISTEDYCFDGMFECVDDRYPNYPGVIPRITEKSEWFTLRGASFRRAVNVAEIATGRKADVICLNAENPENMAIMLNQDKTEFEVEGTASRPMRVDFTWKNLSPCLTDGQNSTKFNLDGSGKAVLVHESEIGKGYSLDITKVFMPLFDYNGQADCDDFRILKYKVKKPEPKQEFDTAPDEIAE
jgi:hypothetical protein